MEEAPRSDRMHGVPRGSPISHVAAERVVLVLSLLLCGWMDLRALFLVLLVTTSDFFITRRIAAALRPKRRLLLFASISIDIGLLLTWRTAGWFAGSVEWLRSAPASTVFHATVVPVGLSFLTLRSLGFVIDVYRGSALPCASWMRFATFLSFFPAFVAGPISRGSQFLPQLQEGIRIRREFLVEGASIFTQGLAKKVLIADRLRTVVDPVFANPERYPPWTVAAGIVAYSLQIYCDFAGYSDMAVGAARAIGLELPQNFQMPYVATSITEFWHRWHITLSTWLRDYIFLPIAYVGSRRVDELGLSRRRGELLNYTVASIITMLVAGLWHGVGWGFLLWGGAHGVALSIHRISQTTGRRRRHMASWLGRVLTFLFVSLAWVPFRAPSVGEAARIYVSLFGLGTQRTYQWFPSWLPICSAAVVLGHLLLLWTTGPGSQPSSSVAKRLMGALGLTAVHRQFAGSNLVPVRITVLGAYFITLFILSILLFSPANLGPFVYGAF